MKYGVIDVGSNSVRLMISDGVNTLYKRVKTTRLAEGMSGGLLTSVAINRTAQAIDEMLILAKADGADVVYCFATAAVRLAKNKQDFLFTVKNLCALDVEVVSGVLEAELGVTGALSGGDGGIIDVGGASAEVAVVQNGNYVYSKSLALGAVSLTDACGQNKRLASEFIDNKIYEYGEIPASNFYAIGGTATTVSAIMQELEPYDANKNHGYKVYLNELVKLTDKLYSMSVDERKSLKGLQPERAKIIAGGALILTEIMKKIGIKCFTVSEKDNLEGYLIKKLEQL